jgi:hypothetical protein
MYTSIKGIYENGVLTFSEPVPNIEKSEVLVTFLNEEKPKSLQKRVPGGLKHLGGSIPDNFNDSLDKIFDL